MTERDANWRISITALRSRGGRFRLFWSPLHRTAMEVKGGEMRLVVAQVSRAVPAGLRNRKAKDSTRRRLEVLVAGRTAQEFKSEADVDFSFVLE